MQSKHQQGHESLRHLHQLIFLNLCGALFLYEHEIEVVRILQIVFRREALERKLNEVKKDFYCQQMELIWKQEINRLQKN